MVSWCDGSPYDIVYGVNASIEPDHDIRSNVDVMRQVWDDEEVVTQSEASIQLTWLVSSRKSFTYLTNPQPSCRRHQSLSSAVVMLTVGCSVTMSSKQGNEETRSSSNECLLLKSNSKGTQNKTRHTSNDDQQPTGNMGQNQCWRKLLLKVMHYNIALLPKKVTNYFYGK